MGKFWSILFFLVPILGTAIFVVAALDQSGPLADHWFPVDVSKYGHVIDGLFMVILWLTGIVFLGTELCLAWFLWRYDAASNPDRPKYTHGSHNLEVIWTVLPAATLLFIAIYQLNAWADTKVREPTDPGLRMEVSARQFEWRLRYPGADGKLGTPDDVLAVNDMHIPVNEQIVIELKSEDVLHSFFLPNLRVKQDAVPGMNIPVWFQAVEPGTFDLVCAELCGWGHYKMRGRLTVESREQFDAWLADRTREQNKATVTSSEVSE